MPISPGNGTAPRTPIPDAADLADLRRRYAQAVLDKAGVTGARLLEAFAAVERERHLPPPPWTILTAEGPVVTSDVADLYADVLVALSLEAGINNGEPSLHAMSMAQAAPRPGERVVHVGAGGGYYSAILAEMVAPNGTVLVREIEPGLAALARRALAGRPGVTVEERSGTEPLPASDVVYVSAAVPVPPEPWLDALAEGARLVFPMTSTLGLGAMLRVERQGGAFAASFFSACRFIPLTGAPESDAGPRLEAAFARRDWHGVRSLHRGEPPPGAPVWFSWRNGWLSTGPVER